MHMFEIVIVVILFLAVFASAELLYRWGVQPHVTRKIAHVGGSIVAALMPLMIPLSAVPYLAVVFLGLLIASKRVSLFPSIHGISETSHGAVLYVPGIALTAALYWPQSTLAFQGAVLVMGFADGGAGLVGRYYGKHTFSITGRKSLEGSATFCALTLLIFVLVYSVSTDVRTFGALAGLMGGAVFVTMLEAVSGRGWDNVLVPLGAGAVLLHFV